MGHQHQRLVLSPPGKGHNGIISVHKGYVSLKIANTVFINPRHFSLQAVCIFSDSKKGVMTPPVLLDLTGDGEEDIIMSLFNSHVIAFDGKTFIQLWNYSVPLSESYK